MAVVKKPKLNGAGKIGVQDDSAAGDWTIAAAVLDLLGDPMEFILSEHARQRQAAALLIRISDGEYDAHGVEMVMRFLEIDYRLHIEDEERALFPALKDHCLSEDNIQDVIRRLEKTHREDAMAAELAIDILKFRIAGMSISENAKQHLRDFAENVLQHLALENGVLLPIARVRLGSKEKKALAAKFKAHYQ